MSRIYPAGGTAISLNYLLPFALYPTHFTFLSCAFRLGEKRTGVQGREGCHDRCVTEPRPSQTKVQSDQLADTPSHAQNLHLGPARESAGSMAREQGYDAPAQVQGPEPTAGRERAEQGGAA